ncbi:helix-turn-helix transcriptional regulator [Streptomyces kanamyceticus]|uniref:Helix-turn-helix domain-containing protein n=1 Tax=Streptomyces kanamyceticus TaxID=1967 RepID=A0A5J6GRW6_STRKN|nr:helix-turn-helix transcriptional regulator [Streptomyces kanamyceticus]QEU96931.1 helix-turn-helix domain-containing protein [Streptomyces kanamyceticus]
MPDRIFDGRKLRDCRVLRRLSQGDVAAAVGVKTNAISRWETGQATPSQERLPGIAQAVEADLDQLFPRLAPPNLADLRCDAGMTQSDTAIYTRTVSPMPVRAAENGKRTLSDDAVTALAKAYKVTRSELLAAQRRSFGHDVPAVTPEGEPPTPWAAQSLAGKIKHLREQVYDGTLPTDEALASAGNRRIGRFVLTADTVRDLRQGTVRVASDEVLDALSLAFVVPLAYFRGDAHEIDRLIALVMRTRAFPQARSDSSLAASTEELGIVERA